MRCKYQNINHCYLTLKKLALYLTYKASTARKFLMPDKAPTFSIRDFSNSSEIYGDAELFVKICEDQYEHGGNLAPNDHWDIVKMDWKDNTYKGNTDSTRLNKNQLEELFQEKYATLKMLMDPWVGCVGERKVEKSYADGYYAYLKDVDSTGLTDLIFDKHGSINKAYEKNLINCDLGSVYDLALLNTVIDFQDQSKINVLEIGAGYGRLAEAILLSKQGGIHYAIVDAVPASLMYCYLYLKDRLPHLKVGSFYTDPLEQSEDFDVFIYPAWHFEASNKVAFDLSINIQSFQEMDQDRVDYYYRLINEVSKDNAHIYFENNRTYVFQGTWPDVPNWQRLIMQHSPRAWSSQTPTELFQKTNNNHSIWNKFIEGLYLQQINHIERLEKLEKHVISDTYGKSILYYIKALLRKILRRP